MEAAITVAIIAAVLALAATVVLGNATSTAEQTNELEQITDEAWSSIDDYKLTCPPGVTPEQLDGACRTPGD